MTNLYVAAAALSALCFYLATRHQSLLRIRSMQRPILRVVAWAFAIAAVLAGVRAYGWWPGVFAALTALMLGSVLLPYLDAWRLAARQKPHVE